MYYVSIKEGLKNETNNLIFLNPFENGFVETKTELSLLPLIAIL